MVKKSKIGTVRFITQLLTLAAVFLIGVNNFLGESGGGLGFLPSASTHNLCPYGGVSTLYSLFTTGNFIPKIHSSAVVILVLILVMTLLFGAIFCGFFCPFGTIQEWVGKIGQKLFPKKYNQFVPRKVDLVLRYVRYLILAKLIYETVMVGKLICEQYDPYYAIMSFFTGEILPLAFLWLGITLVLSIFIERPFCKYICPLGAILGVLSKLAIFKPRRDANTCINCKKCDKACPMNITISTKAAATGHHCISCYKCVSGEACPVDETLTVRAKAFGKKEADHEN